MIYLLYLMGALLTTVLCYLTNPLVVLFADENGELHGILRYWQTWDDSLDSAYFMRDVVPVKFPSFNYDYPKHYVHHIDTTDELAALGRERNYSTLIKPLSEKERLQRYVCRVLWLYRNNAYGFSFWLLGRDVYGEDMVIESTGDVVRGHERYGDAWIYKNDAHICGWLYWKIFLGWKIDYHSPKKKRAMLANRIAVTLK